MRGWPYLSNEPSKKNINLASPQARKNVKNRKDVFHIFPGIFNFTVGILLTLDQKNHRDSVSSKYDFKIPLYRFSIGRQDEVRIRILTEIFFSSTHFKFFFSCQKEISKPALEITPLYQPRYTILKLNQQFIE